MKWLERRFGDDKASMPLFISMHGGGGAPEKAMTNNGTTKYGYTNRKLGSSWPLVHRPTLGTFGMKANRRAVR